MVKHETHAVKTDRLRQLGRERFDALIESGGGTYDMDTACEILGIDREAVLQLIQESRLIALPGNDDLVFPVWQFQDEGLLPELEKVLQVLPDRDAVTQCLFMLMPLLNHEIGQSPIELLKNSSVTNMELILRAAVQYGMQGAK